MIVNNRSSASRRSSGRRRCYVCGCNWSSLSNSLRSYRKLSLQLLMEITLLHVTRTHFKSFIAEVIHIFVNLADGLRSLTRRTNGQNNRANNKAGHKEGKDPPTTTDRSLLMHNAGHIYMHLYGLLNGIGMWNSNAHGITSGRSNS